MSRPWVDPTLHESARRRPNDRRKQAVFLPDAMIREMQREARRQERPLSQVVQLAIRIAMPQIRKNPTVVNA